MSNAHDAPPSGATTSTPPGTVIYAYGVVDGSASIESPVQGLDGTDVFVVGEDRLGVLVSELSVARFGERMWRQHAEDPAWLGTVARAHHAVLSSVAETTDIVPLRVPAIYGDPGRVRHMLETEAPTLDAALTRIREKREWGVKIYAAARPGERHDSPSGSRPTSGRDYLAKRSAQANTRELSRQLRAETIQVIDERLTKSAADAVKNAPQDQAVSGRTEPMLFNAAYLVSRDSTDDFVRLVTELADDLGASNGLQVELTGPWPAYNFAAVTW